MNYERGKKIFYDNYGIKSFMSRNGELSEYQKCEINKADEIIWIEDIVNDIVKKIISGQDVGLIWNLSLMDISNDKKREIYYKIRNNGNKEKIKQEILALKKLFKEDIFIELMEIFK